MTDFHLGISAFYHDSAAAVVSQGRIMAAAQQERFSRRRHDGGFPTDAIRFCLTQAGIRLEDLTTVSYYEDPRLKFRRTLSSFASAGPSGASTFSEMLPEWLRWKARPERRIRRALMDLDLGSPPEKILTGNHHRSHAASAFYPSPYDQAVVLCVDGVGEWQTTSIWSGIDTELSLVNSISYPHSLGLLYSAFTYFCGFKVDSGEYKLMGLAPYGQPIYADKIRDTLIELREDGSFSLDMSKLAFVKGHAMTDEAFERLFDRKRRDPESELTQDDCDLAASIQAVTDDAVLGLAKAAKRMTGEKKLCMAGGVALNCVSNGILSRAGIFDEIWIQPAAGDAGCALGVALEQDVIHTRRRPIRKPGKDAMQGAYLGPEFSTDEIVAFLDEIEAAYETFSDDEIVKQTASHLAKGHVVGWFQGKMEFGPRALGARSILGDPSDADMQKAMNLKVKFRESFRPFAPAVIANAAADYFNLEQESPYMLIVSSVRERYLNAVSARGLGSINEVRSKLPAITHVDNSARVQTVDFETNARFAALLESFGDKTGFPVAVNTSFNVRGEPIVCTPKEAYTCFMRTNMDVLVLGNCILNKVDQKPLEADVDWRSEIALD